MDLHHTLLTLLAALGAISFAPLAHAQTAPGKLAPTASPTAPAQPAPTAIPGYAELAKQAQAGPVMVIFALNAGALGSVENPAAAASFEADPAAITAGQNRLAKEMELARAEAIKPVRGLPLVVADVSAAQLTQIVRSGLVVAVYEDKVSTLSVARAAPHVGSHTLWAVGLKGKGQVVAVLDSGMDGEHSFLYNTALLRSRIYDEACFGTYRPNGSPWFSMCDYRVTATYGPGAAATPCSVVSCNHGTHVTGIVAGDRNPSADVTGIAPEARIMAVNVFSLYGTTPETERVGAFDSDILAGLSYVRTRRLAGEPVAAINLSVGGGTATGYCNSSPFETIIAILRRLDVATVIAAGNDAMSNGVSAVACPPSAVVVGSSTFTDQVSAFSNSSTMVDLLAPGEGIVSSIARTPTSYGASSGTSMAAPLVSGAFALLRQQFPCTPIGIIENALKVSGVNVAHPSNGQVYKRINLAGALHHLRFVEKQYRCPVTNDPTVVTPQVITKE